jgi:ubiquitin-protein ligase E3 A
VGCKQQF